MEVPYLGTVTLDTRFRRHSAVSEPLAIPFLRGQLCRFWLDRYVDDEDRVEIHRAIKNVLSIDDSVLAGATEHVYAYYEDMKALFAEHGWAATPKIAKASDVWSHVTFGNTLSVERQKKRGDEDGVYVSIECECDWEREHGLQIVLRDGLKITKVGPFDGHLTNAAAFGDPAMKGVVYRAMRSK